MLDELFRLAVGGVDDAGNAQSAEPVKDGELPVRLGIGVGHNDHMSKFLRAVFDLPQDRTEKRIANLRYHHGRADAGDRTCSHTLRLCSEILRSVTGRTWEIGALCA